MSNWDFEDGGSFDDERDAQRWADRNRIDPRDVRTRPDGQGVRLEIRRSSLGGGPANHDDRRDGRRTGW